MSQSQDQSSRRKTIFALFAAGALGGTVLTAAPAMAADETYNVPGIYQYTVPAGTYSVAVEAVGGSGGSGRVVAAGGNPGQGGRGAQVSAVIPVEPGTQFGVLVGGQGDSVAAGAITPGGFGGGANGGAFSGGGGGRSEFNLQGARYLVAAGGGGGGGVANGSSGGDGGSGGDPAGQDGARGTTSPQAGGQGSDGTGPGSPGFSTSGAGGEGFENDGGAGSLMGGAGGGGLYGGGGGGYNPNDGGGGGGGSSYVLPSATVASYGVRNIAGDGMVEITGSAQQLPMTECVVVPEELVRKKRITLLKKDCNTSAGTEVKVRKPRKGKVIKQNSRKVVYLTPSKGKYITKRSGRVVYKAPKQTGNGVKLVWKAKKTSSSPKYKVKQKYTVKRVAAQ